VKKDREIILSHKSNDLYGAKEGGGSRERGAFWTFSHLTHVCFSQGKILATCNTGTVGTMHTSLASGNLESGLKGKYFHWKSSVDT